MANSWMKRTLCPAVAAAALAVGMPPATAVEGAMSPYPKGFVGFMSGIVPPQPGLYVSNIYYFYTGTAGSSVRNGFVELGIDVTLNADFLEGTYVTDWKIFGGQYAFGGAIGWAWLDLDASIETQLGGLSASLRNNGFGDSLIMPVLLGWHQGNWHWNTSLFIYAPTGEYSTQRGSLNIGKNIWAFMPTFGVTYFDPKSGLDLSSTFVYVAQTNNSATDYQSGDIMHLDWAAGQHLGSQLEWEIGVAGNVVAQVTGDSGTGAKLGSFKETSVGLGPAVNYSTKIGNNGLILGAKWEHDFDTRNTFKGDVVTVSASLSL